MKRTVANSSDDIPMIGTSPRFEMKLDRLQALLSQFPYRRVAVLGDFFLDKYLEVDSELAEPSLETGRVAHQVVSVKRSPGAAGTVVNNLAALGAGELHALGAVGDDGDGYELMAGLRKLGCSTDGLVRSPDIMTPAYIKPYDGKIPGLKGEGSRFDVKNRRPTPPDIVARITSALDHMLSRVDALIIMDQIDTPDCGVVTQALRTVLADQALRHPRVTFWADSRRNIRQFRNIPIKPNEFEAVGRAKPLPGDELSLHDLQAAVPRLRGETGAPVFVTCGEKGMLVSDPEVCLIPTVRVQGPIDPTGAGDSATAGCVLALASGATCYEAALVGNLVASITVQQLGTTGTATPAQVIEQFHRWEEQNAS